MEYILSFLFGAALATIVTSIVVFKLTKFFYIKDINNLKSDVEFLEGELGHSQGMVLSLLNDVIEEMKNGGNKFEDSEDNANWWRQVE